MPSTSISMLFNRWKKKFFKFLEMQYMFKFIFLWYSFILLYFLRFWHCKNCIGKCPLNEIKIFDEIYEATLQSIFCNNKKARKIRRNLLMRAYKHQEFCDECLLARYQPLDMVLLRNKFKKMNNEQRAAFEAYLKGYYEA